MAVNFSKGINVLLEDLRRHGLEPKVVAKSGDDRIRAAEIAVQGDLVIHWDRDSRSLWAEGPWPRAARLEARLRRLYNRNIFRRAAKQPKILAGIIAACTLLVGSYFLSGRSTASTPDHDSSRPAQSQMEISATDESE